MANSSRLLALLGLLAVAGYQNRDRLGSILGNITGQNNQPGGNDRVGFDSRDASAGGGLGGLLGSLGGLFGGATGGTAAGGGITGALGDLLGQFSSHGEGDVARSWVERGPNRELRPDQLEHALGEDTLRELAAKTGLSRQELLNRLSSVLPAAVDNLTPEGRLPTADEADRWAANARRFAA
jgi:uncharacterized protein YidB (DUF937 family)